MQAGTEASNDDVSMSSHCVGFLPHASSTSSARALGLVAVLATIADAHGWLGMGHMHRPPTAHYCPSDSSGLANPSSKPICELNIDKHKQATGRLKLLRARPVALPLVLCCEPHVMTRRTSSSLAWPQFLPRKSANAKITPIMPTYHVLSFASPCRQLPGPVH